jgi:sigma-E factor negative regulatory protein RseA
MNEALSALMDGEVDELELRRILRELPQRPELYAVWNRYHVMRASIQQEVHRNPSVDLLQGVRARLAAEQESGQDEFGTWAAVKRSRVARYLGQGAIAASFAVAALMGVSVLQTADVGAPAQSIADAGSNAPALNGEFAGEQISTTVAFDVEAYNRLQQAVYREFSEFPALTPVDVDTEASEETTPAE